MNFWLLIIISVLIMIIAVLILKICLLQKSADVICCAFNEKLENDTNTLINISCRDRHMRRLANDINKELKKAKSNVRISILCPGPVDTNFNNVAGVRFSVKSLSSEYVAKYAIDKTLKGKEIIIPGIGIKILYGLNKLSPRFISTELAYHTQKSKKK